MCKEEFGACPICESKTNLAPEETVDTVVVCCSECAFRAEFDGKHVHVSGVPADHRPSLH